ncbi:MAG: hypothetical protein Athens101410_58 [Parcubacteria group bacterium Athens1014_10]|nr:MAG: hypothetical protein Athens101410_58 [Parcubacteria group bacterium Athens1014_10]TSD06084.1 MAG: hypothetical protein Athens071412_58 [Parcubacteria group bacterium Athens0714_12]
MLQTSQDLLFIVIAISVLWLTVFLSIILYYFFVIVRQSSKIIKEWGNRFKKIDEIINLIKEKIGHPAASFVMLAEGIKQIINFLKIKRQTKKKSK